MKSDACFFVRANDQGGREHFTPTELCRGPWHSDHCHAGPPTGLLARAIEQTVPQRRLARLSVLLSRPIPLEGFSIISEQVSDGKTVAIATSRIIGDDGKVAARACGLLMIRKPPIATPTQHAFLGSPDDATPGPFPIKQTHHRLPAFNTMAVEVRYPPGQDDLPGRTALWMRSAPLLADETPSPFQRICPLADCGNAIGRNDDIPGIGFVNADLTIALHRDPVGEWLGSDSEGFWEPDGSGLADARLFDATGAVGRALQTLVLIHPADGGLSTAD